MSRGGHLTAFEKGIPIHPGGRCCMPRHEAAAAHLAGDQPFGFEHFVGRQDGCPIQSKQASQFRVAGKRSPRGKSPDRIFPANC